MRQGGWGVTVASTRSYPPTWAGVNIRRSTGDQAAYWEVSKSYFTLTSLWLDFPSPLSTQCVLLWCSCMVEDG